MKKIINPIINPVVAAGLLLGLSGACNAAWADSRSAEVRLVATINNSPAFQPVTWEVYRVDGTGRRYGSDRHTFIIDSLAPGRYTAVAKRTGQPARKREFFVMADTTNKISIPLD